MVYLLDWSGGVTGVVFPTNWLDGRKDQDNAYVVVQSNEPSLPDPCYAFARCIGSVGLLCLAYLRSSSLTPFRRSWFRGLLFA